MAAVGCGAAKTISCAEVEYEGTGQPDLIMVSDLPLQGGARAMALQLNDAFRGELRARKFKAGDFTIGLRTCDDSTASAGRSDPRVCSANATAHADDDRVIGVLGPLDSHCATILIPALEQAPGGAIPIISPTNTYACLTRGGAGCDLSEPEKYYPSGIRNYLRVAGNDVFQAAAAAQFARDRGAERVYVLHDQEAYGVGVATRFRSAAQTLGIEVVGFEGWDAASESYTSLFEKVKRKRADAVFLGGLITRNGAQLIRDKLRVLGPNNGAVALLASDGFAKRRSIDEAGAAADGMFVAAAGVPSARLPRQARRYNAAFAARYLDGKQPQPSTIFGAQAARIMLDAIAASDGTRADVTARLFDARVKDGLLGTFRFARNGDPAAASGPVVGFTIFRADGGLKVETTIEPDPSTVRAAGRE